MHGDDVASAGVEVATKIVSKNTELIMELLKVLIDKERDAVRKKQSLKGEVLSGGEVTYQRLKEGARRAPSGEVTMLPSFAKEDYKAFLKKAKAMDIPVAAIQESGKENTLSLFFNVKDKEAVNSIVQDIVREKLKQPEQTERMITIEKEQVEGFQMYCVRQFIVWFTDIPVNFLETQGGVKCIFGADYEKQMEVAVENYRNIRSELSQIGTEVEKNVKGKFQIKLTDNEQGKSLTMNFCTKAKLERVLQERMGYSEVKAVEVANSLTNKLTDSQRQYYLSGSRQLGEMDFYETNIKFDDDNLLLENYSFVKLKANGDDEPKLTVTDKSGNFVVLSAKSVDRAEVESKIRSYLKINDSETIKAILDKSERLGFAEQPKQVQFKEFQIERDTQSSFTVRGAPSLGGSSTVARLDLNNKESAKKQLVDAFGISYEKHKSFASNPLLLNIMLLTYDNYADIPEKLHLFYANAFETLYSKYDATKGGYKRELKAKLSIDLFRQIFSNFCFITYFQGKMEFTNQDLSAFLEKSKINNIEFDIEAMIDDLVNSICVLYKDGLNYRFTHRSFQEYFFGIIFKRIIR